MKQKYSKVLALTRMKIKFPVNILILDFNEYGFGLLESLCIYKI